jgi:hypothetical protein
MVCSDPDCSRRTKNGANEMTEKLGRVYLVESIVKHDLNLGNNCVQHDDIMNAWQFRRLKNDPSLNWRQSSNLRTMQGNEIYALVTVRAYFILDVQ